MNQSIDIKKMMQAYGKSARDAARQLALFNKDKKNAALAAIATNLQHHTAAILAANEIDMHFALEKKLSSSLLDRLHLNPSRIDSMSQGLLTIANLPDPIGEVLATVNRPNGLQIERVCVPIGVLGVIYESRPNVTIDAAGLCIKSGNAVILRGGSESFHTNSALLAAIHDSLNQIDFPSNVVQMVATPDRLAVNEMLKMDSFIDVIIPRGGQELMKQVIAESCIPVFKHLAGICHTYLHQAADMQMAKDIILNAKMRRTGICGATEVLLIDEAILNTDLLPIFQQLIKAGCELRGDESIAGLMPEIKLANAMDFDTEFLAPILAMKKVKNIEQAILHIATHGTQHTDAIITNDPNAANQFFQSVDSAIVMHNTSTQFADGGEFGMGAEIGIATGKLHARGPVGVEQLTTFKYLVHGSGQVRA